MTQASIAQAGASVLGVVNESANAVANLFTAAGGAVTMLNRYVTDAQQKQALASTISMSDYKVSLIQDKALESAKRERTILQELKADSLLEACFNDHKDRIEKLFSETSN